MIIVSGFKLREPWISYDPRRTLQQKYQEVIDFIETNHRNPSKHRIEEHLMLNVIKHNRKLLNAGKMKADRNEKFNELLVLVNNLSMLIYK